MTPEERAAAVVEELYDLAVIPTGGRDTAAEHIAAAIRAAVDEERERCAKVADEAADDRDIGDVEYAGSYLAATIAARIRAGEDRR